MPDKPEPAPVTDEMTTLAATLIAAKSAVDDAKAALKSAEDAFAKTQSEMIAVMKTSGAEQFKAEDRFVSLKQTRRFAVLKDKRDDIVVLLQAKKPELVKASVHASTLNKLANEMSDDKAPPAWWADARAMLAETMGEEVRVTKNKPKP